MTLHRKALSGHRSSFSAFVLPACIMVTGHASAQEPAGTPAQPPPFTAPRISGAPVAQSPGQSVPPATSVTAPGTSAPLPRQNGTTVDLRAIAPLAPEAPAPSIGSPAVTAAETTSARPGKEAPSPFVTSPFRLVAPYRAARLPDLPPGNSNRIASLIRDGKLYLSVRDAVALAIENNLDVEVSRYNLLAADTDILRAAGGGNLRGIDYTVQQTAPGIGSVSSPLLNTATTAGAGSVNVQVNDLSQITQAGNTVGTSLSQNGTSTYAPGPAIPLFDPTLTAEAGYLHRSTQVSLIGNAGATGSAADNGSGTTTGSGPAGFVSTGIDYQQGFSFGAQLEAFVSNAPQVLYATDSQYDPFHAPSTNFTVTQPLLRGRGRAVNLRFVHIAKLDQQVSRLVFEQQVLETIYGISRLYYDLVSLGENVGVKEEALAAAQRLTEDNRSQVAQGTLAPIELTRTEALLASSRLDLIQARSEYRQQEVILREQLLRRLPDSAAQFAIIVPTDRINVPQNAPVLDASKLTADALARRPDLAQAALQVKANEIAANGTANGTKPLLNVYGNVQTRGSSLVPYQTIGSTGNGTVVVPPALTQGGLRLSTIYQGGIQLNLPLRNRIAQADAARDAIQLRQSQGRSAKLENDIRQQVENSTIAIQNAHEAYAAAVESRNYQQQLLQAEIDKFAVGASTNFQIVQDEAYLAQARSTEVAARSDYMKAQMALDRALGDLLEKNGISIDDAIIGNLNKPPSTFQSAP